MRVKIGNEWFAVKPGQPIMIEFSSRDLANVRAMAPDARLYACAETGEFDGRKAFADWMDAGRFPMSEEK